MSLVTQVSDLATRIGTEIKGLKSTTGLLTNLTTTDKTTLVAAINEVRANAAAGGGDVTTANITDATALGRNIIKGADGPAVRSLIGAGTGSSNLAIGTTGTTAKAGDYQPTAADISNATAIGRTVLTAADGPAVRSAIGAGTSNLAIGTTGTTAKAGNYQPTAANISDATAVGRSVLTAANAGAALTAIGGQSASDVDARISSIIGTAPAALDTLQELAEALGGDAAFAATVNTALSNRVRADAAQSFTAPQQQQARSNIGAASATDVGPTTTNFVTVFEAALA